MRRELRSKSSVFHERENATIPDELRGRTHDGRNHFFQIERLNGLRDVGQRGRSRSGRALALE
jgi:hypothetical protein